MPTDSKSYTILLANTSCLIRAVVTAATQQFDSSNNSGSNATVYGLEL